MSVNLLSQMTLGWWSVYVRSDSTPSLDRDGISIAIANMLKADSNLYGATTASLLQIIEGDPKKFDKAKVDAKRNRYGLYLWAEASDSVSVRSQNKDIMYTINMRFEGANQNVTAGLEVIEDAYNMVMDLIDAQMWDGQYLTAYYTDSTASVINMESVSSSLPAPEVSDSFFTLEVEGVATVEINRWQ